MMRMRRLCPFVALCLLSGCVETAQLEVDTGATWRVIVPIAVPEGAAEVDFRFRALRGTAEGTLEVPGLGANITFAGQSVPTGWYAGFTGTAEVKDDRLIVEADLGSVQVRFETTVASEPGIGREAKFIAWAQGEEFTYLPLLAVEDDDGGSHDYGYFQGGGEYSQEWGRGEPVLGVHLCTSVGWEPAGWLELSDDH